MKTNAKDLSQLAQEARAKKLVEVTEELYGLMVAKGLKMTDSVMVVDVLQKKVAQASQKMMSESDLV